MLFNSFKFLFLFLPLALLAYYAPARMGWRRAATVALVIASLLFYADWGWRYLPLLCASTLLNYAAGRYIQRSRDRRALVIGVGGNLMALAYFKYSGLAVETVNWLAGLHLPAPHITLPLAISFYTFTQIAFLVDSYKGAAAELNLSRYSLFVSFFPHLIAGPIVHHREIMPQFADSRSQLWLPENIRMGAAWLTLGLSKKVLIADKCAVCADAAFGAHGPGSMLAAWMGLIAYTMQIYFDFSGYSDMAIGLGWLFNIRLPDNFDAPYRAEDIAAFWRQWHITLSRFLRDYLYIPLGGNRGGEAMRCRNLFITMLLGGLWHGASWTFVAWGGYHGALLILCQEWRKTGIRVPAPAARSLTFGAVAVGWCLFRASTLPAALRYLGLLLKPEMPSLKALDQAGGLGMACILAALVIFVNVAPTTKRWIESRSLDARHGVLLGLLFCCCIFAMRDVSLHFAQSSFIYFNF